MRLPTSPSLWETQQALPLPRGAAWRTSCSQAPEELLQQGLRAVADVAAEPAPSLEGAEHDGPAAVDAVAASLQDLRLQCDGFRPTDHCMTTGTDGVVLLDNQRVGRASRLGKNACCIACSLHTGCRRIVPGRRVNIATFEARAAWYFWVGRKYSSSAQHLALLDQVVL